MLKFIKKWWYTWRNKPYLDVRVTCRSDGKTQIGVDFNMLMIAEIDMFYRELSWWDVSKPNNVKMALYLHDLFSQIAEPHLPEEPPARNPMDDLIAGLDQIPTLAVRGGQENVTRVDIAKAQRFGQPYRDYGNG